MAASMFECCGQRHEGAGIPQSVDRLSDDAYFPYTGPGPWFTCSADAEMQPRLAKRGYAGPLTEVSTLPGLLRKLAARKGSMLALQVERPVPVLQDGQAPPALPREEWTTWTFAQYHEDTRLMARAFIKLGFRQFDTANIWGFNSPEWFMSVMSAMYAGGKCGGIYPTDTPATAAYKVVHSGGSIITVEGKSHIDRVIEALNQRSDARHLKAVIVWAYEPAAGETVPVAGCGNVPVLSWSAALEFGRSEPEDELQRRFEATKPGHCCALIYTSGTTGEPKAVMVSHDNIIYMSNTCLMLISQSCGFGQQVAEERILSYLPLSHVAGLCVDLVSQLAVGALMPAWVTILFARPYDLKVGAIKDRLLIARPTIFLGVPLVWEKFADKIRAIGAATEGLKKSISSWAKETCLTNARSLQLGGDRVVPMGHSLAMMLMSAVKGAIGLDQCKFACTGAAPIRVDTLEYFSSLGIYINELYGMSESSAIVTVSTDLAHEWGSCGYQLNGTEVKAFKVDPADFNNKAECPLAPRLDCIDEEYQGELCFRGRGIMMGYLACTDMGPEHVQEINQKTAETIDRDGWLHSGDKGLKTERGMLKITGRYKELIIGDGGENIAPVPIEDNIKSVCDAVAECMMIGDRRKYNVAILTLKAAGANGESPGTDELDAAAKLVNPGVTKISQAVEDPIWIDTLTAAITKTNANQKIVPNNAFKIQKFTILPHNFSEMGGELTPTKKLKRKVVEDKYSRIIERMYITDGTYISYEV